MLFSLALVLSGCSNVNKPITSHSTGFWDHYIVYNFSQFILWLASLVHNNYGLAIIIFTIIIRVALLPLNWFQTRSMKKQMDVQPQIKELQEKYSGKDVESRTKLSEETQKLYSEAGINPLAGCLPVVLQIPVMIALYQAIFRTPQLRTGTFLWMQLGKPDPYYIMPALAAIFTFAGTYLSIMSQPEQNATTKSMLWTMPVIIFISSMNLASAVTIYWVTSSLFQIFQTLLLQNPFKIRREQQKKIEGEKNREKKIRKAKKKLSKSKK